MNDLSKSMLPDADEINAISITTTELKNYPSLELLLNGISTESSSSESVSTLGILSEGTFDTKLAKELLLFSLNLSEKKNTIDGVIRDWKGNEKELLNSLRWIEANTKEETGEETKESASIPDFNIETFGTHHTLLKMGANSDRYCPGTYKTTEEIVTLCKRHQNENRLLNDSIEVFGKSIGKALLEDNGIDSRLHVSLRQPNEHLLLHESIKKFKSRLEEYTRNAKKKGFQEKHYASMKKPQLLQNSLDEYSKKLKKVTVASNNEISKAAIEKDTKEEKEKYFTREKQYQQFDHDGRNKTYGRIVQARDEYEIENESKLETLRVEHNINNTLETEPIYMYDALGDATNEKGENQKLDDTVDQYQTSLQKVRKERDNTINDLMQSLKEKQAPLQQEKIEFRKQFEAENYKFNKSTIDKCRSICNNKSIIDKCRSVCRKYEDDSQISSVVTNENYNNGYSSVGKRDNDALNKAREERESEALKNIFNAIEATTKESQKEGDAIKQSKTSLYQVRGERSTSVNNLTTSMEDKADSFQQEINKFHEQFETEKHEPNKSIIYKCRSVCRKYDDDSQVSSLLTKKDNNNYPFLARTNIAETETETEKMPFGNTIEHEFRSISRKYDDDSRASSLLVEKDNKDYPFSARTNIAEAEIEKMPFENSIGKYETKSNEVVEHEGDVVNFAASINDENLQEKEKLKSLKIPEGKRFHLNECIDNETRCGRDNDKQRISLSLQERDNALKNAKAEAEKQLLQDKIKEYELNIQQVSKDKEVAISTLEAQIREKDILHKEDKDRLRKQFENEVYRVNNNNNTPTPPHENKKRNNASIRPNFYSADLDVPSEMVSKVDDDEKKLLEDVVDNYKMNLKKAEDQVPEDMVGKYMEDLADKYETKIQKHKKFENEVSRVNNNNKIATSPNENKKINNATIRTISSRHLDAPNKIVSNVNDDENKILEDVVDNYKMHLKKAEDQVPEDVVGKYKTQLQKAMQDKESYIHELEAALKEKDTFFEEEKYKLRNQIEEAKGEVHESVEREIERVRHEYDIRLREQLDNEIQNLSTDISNEIKSIRDEYEKKLILSVDKERNDTFILAKLEEEKKSLIDTTREYESKLQNAIVDKENNAEQLKAIIEKNEDLHGNEKNELLEQFESEKRRLNNNIRIEYDKQLSPLLEDRDTKINIAKVEAEKQSLENTIEGYKIKIDQAIRDKDDIIGSLKQKVEGTGILYAKEIKNLGKQLKDEVKKMNEDTMNRVESIRDEYKKKLESMAAEEEKQLMKKKIKEQEMKLQKNMEEKNNYTKRLEENIKEKENAQEEEMVRLHNDFECAKQKMSKSVLREIEYIRAEYNRKFSALVAKKKAEARGKTQAENSLMKETIEEHEVELEQALKDRDNTIKKLKAGIEEANNLQLKEKSETCEHLENKIHNLNEDVRNMVESVRDENKEMVSAITDVLATAKSKEQRKSLANTHELYKIKLLKAIEKNDKGIKDLEATIKEHNNIYVKEKSESYKQYKEEKKNRNRRVRNRIGSVRDEYHSQLLHLVKEENNASNEAAKAETENLSLQKKAEEYKAKLKNTQKSKDYILKGLKEHIEEKERSYEMENVKLRKKIERDIQKSNRSTSETLELIRREYENQFTLLLQNNDNTKYDEQGETMNSYIEDKRNATYNHGVDFDQFESSTESIRNVKKDIKDIIQSNYSQCTNDADSKISEFTGYEEDLTAALRIKADDKRKKKQRMKWYQKNICAIIKESFPHMIPKQDELFKKFKGKEKLLYSSLMYKVELKNQREMDDMESHSTSTLESAYTMQQELENPRNSKDRKDKIAKQHYGNDSICNSKSENLSVERRNKSNNTKSPEKTESKKKRALTNHGPYLRSTTKYSEVENPFR